MTDFKFGNVLEAIDDRWPGRRLMFICPGADMIGWNARCVLIKKDPDEERGLFSMRNSKVGDIVHISTPYWRQVVDADA